jgi:hypothetical protein
VRILAALGTVLPLVLVGPAFASELRLEGETCFERTYDPAHLASRPKQKVRRIRVSAAPGSGRDITASLDVWVRGSTERYAVHATCRPERDRMTCRSEFDDRRWHLSASAADKLLVINGDLWLNPWAYDSEDRSDRGFRLWALPDDRSWLLARVRCPANPNE